MIIYSCGKKTSSTCHELKIKNNRTYGKNGVETDQLIKTSGRSVFPGV